MCFLFREYKSKQCLLNIPLTFIFNNNLSNNINIDLCYITRNTHSKTNVSL